MNNNNMNNNYMNENRRNNIMNNLREIITGYNNTNQLYNLNMYDYNRNIQSLIRLLEQMTTNSTRSSNRYISSTRETNNRRNTFLDDDYYNSILFRLTTQLNNSLSSPNSRGLNETQLQQYTQIVQYNSSLSESRCYITHESFNENEDICQIIHCGHYFKPNAIRRWLENNTTCPVCRYDLTSQQVVHTDISNNMDASNNMNMYRELPSLQDYSNNQIYSFTNIPLSSQQLSTMFTNLDMSNNLTYTFDFPLYLPSQSSNSSNI